MPDYTMVMETNDHCYIRPQPSKDSGTAGELSAGIRVMADTSAVAGGPHDHGNQWYPVQFQGEPAAEGFIADYLLRVV